MASPTKHSETVREHKRKRSGKRRKQRLHNYGSTLSAQELFAVQDVSTLPRRIERPQRRDLESCTSI